VMGCVPQGGGGAGVVSTGTSPLLGPLGASSTSIEDSCASANVGKSSATTSSSERRQECIGKYPAAWEIARTL